jgi:2-polyprenyl-3-methyl-5-hydroxy-6-metoxy-1,4-benzoquinol methylase
LGLQGGQAGEVEKVVGKLGIHTSYGWEVDPKRLAFTAARYLFVGKLLEGRRSVLEVGCGDAFMSRVVRQHLHAEATLQVVDINRKYIGSAKENNPKDGRWRVYPGDWDILESPLGPFDAVYCLDLFEHIPEEDRLLSNLAGCAPVCVVGTPSLESQEYASPISRLEHVNCKTRDGLRASMQRHFKQVFLFGMTDTVIHNGPAASYLFALGVNAS